MLAHRRLSPTTIAPLSIALIVGCASGVDPERGGSAATTGSGGVAGGLPGTGLVATNTGGFVTGTGGTLVTGSGGGANSGGVIGTSGAGGTNPGNGGGTSTGGQVSLDAGPPAVGVLVGQYEVPGGVNPKDDNIKADLQIVNRSDKTIPVQALTIRYFYTIDGAAPSTTDYQELWIDYADIGRISGGNTSAKLSFAKMAKPQKGADHYIQVAFQGPYELAPGGSTNQVQIRANWKGYSQTYDETNDYSWDGTKTSFVDWQKVTVYENGVLVWGTEPDGTKPKPPSDGGTEAGGSPDGGGGPSNDSGTPPADAGRG